MNNDPANDIDVQRLIIDTLRLQVQDLRDSESYWRRRALQAESHLQNLLDDATTELGDREVPQYLARDLMRAAGWLAVDKEMIQ